MNKERQKDPAKNTQETHTDCIKLSFVGVYIFLALFCILALFALFSCVFFIFACVFTFWLCCNCLRLGHVWLTDNGKHGGLDNSWAAAKSWGCLRRYLGVQMNALSFGEWLLCMHLACKHFHVNIS